MKKVQAIFLAALLLSLTFFPACSSTGFDLFKGGESATALSESSKSSNEYVFNIEEYHALNRYLSIFVQTGFMRKQAFNLSAASEADYKKITQLYCSFAKEEELERGSYARWADCRIEEKIFRNALYELFKLDLDLSSEGSDNLFFEDDFWYWNSEMLTSLNSNFALINKIETMGNRQYSISFTLYSTRDEQAMGAGSKAYFSYSHDRAIREFPRGSISGLSAIVYAEDLSDINTMTLEYMQKNTASS